MDHYRVETVERGNFAVVRFGDDGQRAVYMTLDYLAAVRTCEELVRAEARGFKAGLIVGHDEKLKRPKT